MVNDLKTHKHTIEQLMKAWQLERKQVMMIRAIIMDESTW